MFQCVQNLASSTLGSILGTYTLSSLLSARSTNLPLPPVFLRKYFREEIANTVLEVFSVACDPWGVQVERVEVGLVNHLDLLIITPVMVFTLQVKNLAVAKEMVVSMAVEAKVRFF